MASFDVAEWVTGILNNFAEWRWSDVIGLALAVAAFIFGLRQTTEIRNASREVRSVQEALSTRFIGKFPLFLADIVELIRSARKEIIIFCDYPAYGEFSDPAGAVAYRYAIEQQRLGNVTVDLTCMDAANRARDVEEQFEPTRWTHWQEDEVRRNAVRSFLKARGVAESEEITREKLLEMMEDSDQQAMQTVFGGNVVQIPVSMPIYFWIADRRKAIFTIPNVAEDEYEYGFSTADLALIQALLRMRDRYRGMPAVVPVVSA